MLLSLIVDFEMIPELTRYKVVQTVDGSQIHLGMQLWIVGEVPGISSIVVTGIVEFHAGIVRLLNQGNVDAYSDWAYASYANAVKERTRLDV